MKFGAIDIGTNAARLLIGEVVENEDKTYLKKISYTRVPLRLGVDVFDTGIISDHKIIEFRKTIQAFKLIAEVFNVVDIRACATSAMREAENGNEVQRYIQMKTDVNIEVIDGDEESSLILSNFLIEDKNSEKDFVVIDVGGGSTEISIFNHGNLVASKSFDVGTIRLLKGKVSEDIWSESKSWIQKNIGDDHYEIQATGGNINKAHKMLGKKSNDAINYAEFKEFTKRIQGMTPRERMNEFKLKADRADVIGPACRIYLHFFKALRCDEVVVPKVGLSDGILYNLHRRYQEKKKESAAANSY